MFARALAFAFLFVFGVRAAALFMLVVSTMGLRTGFLPRWLVVAGYVGGLVFLFTVSYVELLVLIFPAWVTAVSMVILAQAVGSSPAPGRERQRSTYSLAPGRSQPAGGARSPSLGRPGAGDDPAGPEARRRPGRASGTRAAREDCRPSDNAVARPESGLPQTAGAQTMDHGCSRS